MPHAALPGPRIGQLLTKDGFVDMATEYPATATMTNIQRVN